MRDPKTGKHILPQNLCINCGMRPKAYDGDYCRKCEDDRSHGHRQEARICPYCGAVKIDKNPSHTYYCRRRRGIG
ncbi:hypothetical protein IH922_03365 [candidate division KSB1 bacterium]|nr:hypothetical protein [candidate division KSB1 bacterium]